MDYWTITKDEVTFHALRDPQYEWFWPRVVEGSWEPDTFAAFRAHVPPGGLYIDVGAWIGPTLLYAGHIAGRAVAIEPDAVAMAGLLKNLRLNPSLLEKTEVFNLALMPDSGDTLTLYAEDFGNSMSSKLTHFSGGSKNRVICGGLGITAFFDRAFQGETACFIKIDVEGAEYELLPRICDYLDQHGIKATLYLSLHGQVFVDPGRAMSAWAANLARHGTVLARIAAYGELHLWNGTAWEANPVFGDGAQTAFASLLDYGGLYATLLVTPRR